MKRRVIRTIGVAAFFCVMMLAAPSVESGVYIWVPTDQPTIQAGIDAAVDGDTVMVLAGTYSGTGNRDLDFKGKKIWVYGFGGQQSTIIDCGGSSTEHHGGFIFQTNEDSTCLLTGFTIRNAWYPLPNNDSGAVSIRVNSAPRITFCTITNNHAHGVAIYYQAQPRLMELRISHNEGWGIWMPEFPSFTKTVTISLCLIDHNKLGGLLQTISQGGTSIASNTIVENGGVGLYLSGEPPLSSASLLDTNTTIEGNIIAFNAGYGIMRGCCWFPGLHYYRNDVYGNVSGNLPMLAIGTDSVCMISVDPLFCRQGGNAEYSLQAGSPCLAPNNGCGVDMGAFVGQGCTSCCIGMRGNIDCDLTGLPDIADLTRLIDYLYISFAPLCCEAAANIDGEGSVDISDLTSLIDYLYISFTLMPNCS